MNIDREIDQVVADAEEKTGWRLYGTEQRNLFLPANSDIFDQVDKLLNSGTVKEEPSLEIAQKGKNRFSQIRTSLISFATLAVGMVLLYWIVNPDEYDTFQRSVASSLQSLRATPAPTIFQSPTSLPRFIIPR